MRALKLAGAAIVAVIVVIALLLVIGVPSSFLTSQIEARVERLDADLARARRLIGTSAAPMRAQPKNVATYSGEFVAKMATLSPRPIPLAINNRATRLASASSQRRTRTSGTVAVATAGRPRCTFTVEMRQRLAG